MSKASFHPQETCAVELEMSLLYFLRIPWAAVAAAKGREYLHFPRMGQAQKTNSSPLGYLHAEAEKTVGDFESFDHSAGGQPLEDCSGAISLGHSGTKPVEKIQGYKLDKVIF